MVEVLKNSRDSLITSEYAKNWTETSSNSMLWNIKRTLNNPKLKNLREIKDLNNKIQNREYKSFQKILWIPHNRCDWKLWRESHDHFNNYINRIKKQYNIRVQTDNDLSKLKLDTWKIENLVDTTRIQNNEAQYLAAHETMNQNEYNKLFSGKEMLQQWQFGDCYLVSWINQLARAQHFDTLMRTSIQRMKWKNWDTWYQIKIPLWEPSWRKILLKDSELSVAKIRWNIWYKLLELAYAKNKLRKNDKNGNKYRPITPAELKKIEWWWTHEVLQKFLGKNNIWFSDFWTLKNYRTWKRLSQSSQMAKNEIHNFLKNYIPGIGNKFVSLASLPGASDRKSYTVWWKTIFCSHAYSLTWVLKNSKWEVSSITVLNPRNAKWQWKNYQTFTLDEFYKSFSAIWCWKIKTKDFLNNKSA